MGNSEQGLTELDTHRTGYAKQGAHHVSVYERLETRPVEPRNGVSGAEPAAGVVRWVWMARAAARHSARRDRYARSERLLVIGEGAMADHLIAHLSTRARRYRFVGQLVPLGSPHARGIDPARIDRRERLEDIVARHGVSRIVTAMADRRGELPVEQLLACRLSGIEVEDATAFCETLHQRIPLNDLKPSYLVFGGGFQSPSRAVKRTADIALALLGLLLSAPLFVLLPVLIRWSSPGPVFYRQERVGWRGRRFMIMKFRSMYDGAEDSGRPVWAAESDPRVTSVGRLMRRFRLDELPQLLNVLKGDMSVVGPRPERPEFTAMLTREIPYYSLRLSVKPGITGWAQVKYRYGASVQDAIEKLQYDLYYIKHMSVWLDAWIALRTLHTVLFQSGAR